MTSSEPPLPSRCSEIIPPQPGDVSSSSFADSSQNRGSDVHLEPISTTTPERLDTVLEGNPRRGIHPQSRIEPSPKNKDLGRYRTLDELGRGGMGVVYLAEDTILKRKVALKIPQFEHGMVEQQRARFTQEAQLAAQLTHPNICQIYDVGEIDGQLVMAMEYVEGHDLSAFTKPEKLLSERAAVALVKKIALAVDVAHKKGLVHRDLKPSNIMLSQPDKSTKVVEPKVMDFGLAKLLDSTDKQLTQSGMTVGTPCYMSKEQWIGKGGKLGPSSDVFSLGVILYELLTGHLPYDSEEGETAAAWFARLFTTPQIWPRVRKPGIALDLESIVMRSIAKEQEDRYATMAELAAALDGWLKGKSPAAKSDESADHSLLEVSLDFSKVAPPVSAATVTQQLPRMSMGGLRNWQLWLGGVGATVLLGVVLIFLNSESDTTLVSPDSPTSSFRASDSTVAHSSSDQPVESTRFPSALPPSFKDLIGLEAGDLREVTLPGGVKLKQAWCPPGKFQMGSPADERNRSNNEGQVEVTLTNGFWLAQTETTQEQWTAVMGETSTPWSGKPGVKVGPDFPASYISYGLNSDGTFEANSATSFCAKMTEIERKAGRLPVGWKYALPSEAQWEYACRAGTTTSYNFAGDESQLVEYAWFELNTIAIGEPYTHKVGAKKANMWGIYDMHGNLWEWCADGYVDKYPGGVNPMISPGDRPHVFRGGSWYLASQLCRSAYRGWDGPSLRSDNVGFRVATIPDE